MLLGALGSVPAEPLPVWVVSVTAPDAPELAPMQAVGGFYNVGAEATTSAEVDAPFALALPIPEGTDTTHLVIAVLDPPDLVGDVGPPAWFPVQGMVNPEAGLFSVTLPTLFRQGATVALATHPELAPLEPPAPAAARADDPPGPELLPDFDITCKDYTDPSQCGEADRVRMNGLLKAAHDDFVSFGFGKPRLIAEHLDRHRHRGRQDLREGGKRQVPATSSPPSPPSATPACSGSTRRGAGRSRSAMAGARRRRTRWRRRCGTRCSMPSSTGSRTSTRTGARPRS